MNDIIINYFQYLDNPLTIVSIINVSIYVVITYIIRGKWIFLKFNCIGILERFLGTKALQKSIYGGTINNAKRCRFVFYAK